jgi:hypothetical protein
MHRLWVCHPLAKMNSEGQPGPGVMPIAEFWHPADFPNREVGGVFYYWKRQEPDSEVG